MTDNGRLLLALTALLVAPPAALAQPAASRAEPIPAWVLENWEHLIGTWVADNTAFKDENDTMDAYGVEWAWGLGKKSLTGRLYGIRAGEEVATFWELREFWHPGKGELVATQFGVNGTYGEGPGARRPDGSIETLQTFYDPSTGAVFRVGHRSSLEGDVHTTRSFDVDDAGTWKDRRTYTWRRQR